MNVLLMLTELWVAFSGTYFFVGKKVGKKPSKPHATLIAAPTPRASWPSRLCGESYARRKLVEMLPKRVWSSLPTVYFLLVCLGLSCLTACAPRSLPEGGSTDWQAATKQLSRLIEKDSSRVDLLHKRGYAYYQQGEYALSIADYREALETDTLAVPSSQYNLGMAQLKLRRYEAAAQTLETLVAVADTHVRAHYHLGMAYLYQEEWMAALEAFDKVVVLQPRMVNAYLHRGVVHHHLGSSDRAIQDFNVVISNDAEHAEAHSNRGLAQYEAGNYEYARMDLDNAIQFDSTLAVAWYQRGLVSFHENQVAGALPDFDQAIRLDSSEAAFFMARSLAHLALLDTLAAEQDQARAEALRTPSGD